MIFILSSIFFLVSALYLFYQHRKFQHIDQWEKIDAKVLSAKIVKYICFTAYNALEQQSLRENIYKPIITYSYK